jgi:hypothetical protein
MAQGLSTPPWPPALHPDSSDSFAIARIVNHLGLGKGDYLAAVELAAHHLDDPFVKGAIATVADALGEHGVLSDQQVREALGPQLLEWFARADDQELAV